MKKMYKPKKANKQKMETFMSKLANGEFKEKIKINYINIGKDESDR